MMSFVGFPVIAGIAAPVLLSLLLAGGVMLGLFLLALVVWYGLVQIRIFFRI